MVCLIEVDQTCKAGAGTLGGQSQGSSKLRCSYLTGLVHCGNIPLCIGRKVSTKYFEPRVLEVGTYVMAPLSVAPSPAHKPQFRSVMLSKEQEQRIIT